MTPSWVEDAICRTVDSDLWSTEKNGPGAAEETRAARQICADCPVRRECLDYAMRCEAGVNASSRYGIYGGLTGSERHALQEEIDRRAAEGTPVQADRRLRTTGTTKAVAA